MRSIAAVVLGSVLVVGACAPAAPATSDSLQAPALTPVPAAPVGPPTQPSAPAADLADATEGERQLLSGARLDLQGSCTPLRADLAARAVAAVECRPVNDYVERVTMFLFDNQADLLDTYFARLAAHGVEQDLTDGRPCTPENGAESAYVPANLALVAERNGCWVDDTGATHYIATRPPFVLLELDGKAGNTPDAVRRFAWLGNQDQPGAPTLWNETPMSPEK